jgi:DUF971 family protein
MTESQDRTTPTGVTHDRNQRALLISWRDGHESIFELDVLREICPCVTCRGGHDKMGPEHSPDILTLTPANSYELQDMQLVGNYALQLTWHDGHDSGIYTWEYLRDMCSCEVCLAEHEIGKQG